MSHTHPQGWAEVEAGGAWTPEQVAKYNERVRPFGQADREAREARNILSVLADEVENPNSLRDTCVECAGMAQLIGRAQENGKIFDFEERQFPLLAARLKEQARLMSEAAELLEKACKVPQ